MATVLEGFALSWVRFAHILAAPSADLGLVCSISGQAGWMGEEWREGCDVPRSGTRDADKVRPRCCQKVTQHANEVSRGCPAGNPPRSPTGGPLSVAFDRIGLIGMLQTENTCILPAFAHESEEEFSKFLDFYNIQWSYEPICFPIDWDDEGKVRECFTPDFYLPQFELYVELTTMKQRLVTKKNRKVRRMREHYPDINVKILYNRDYRELLFKFGMLG